MLDLLVECLKPTNVMVKNLVHVQNSYINTYHPDFMGGANTIFTMFDPAQEQQKADELMKPRMQMEALGDAEHITPAVGKGAQTPVAKNTMPIKKQIG